MKIFWKVILAILITMSFSATTAHAQTSKETLQELKANIKKGTLPTATCKLGDNYKTIRTTVLGGNLDISEFWYVYTTPNIKEDIDVSYWFYSDRLNQTYFSPTKQKVIAMKKRYERVWSKKQIETVFGKKKKVNYSDVYIVGNYYVDFDRWQDTTRVSIANKKHYKKYGFGT